ncbi:MAG: NGG1p interacting factor NIF3 [Desulfitibacter sp. BRH_c19]|nr:MAG: NGG1p interacting factor NIF3 [Desulfitibacter sp. BRH_c19]
MKLKDIYQLAIQLGIENDPRDSEMVERVLRLAKEEFAELKYDKKKDFDQDKLDNPYADTRILAGESDQEIKCILTGIDMEVGEVLLADRLNEKGQKIDLILSHHPEGKALARLSEVMKLQEDLLNKWGVPISVAEGIMTKRIKEVDQGLWPINHNRTIDAAKLLGFAFMCTHTPADNLVTTFLQNYLDKAKPETLKGVVETLKEIPEFAQAIQTNAGPKILLGTEKRRAGKTIVEMTGGTSGSEDAFAKLSQAGISTLIVMHMGEKHRKLAEKNNMNVIVAGHMASDSLGMNLLLDKIEEKDIKIITCSGLIRVSRN